MKYYEKLTMTGEEVKRKLREQGITLKEWANARGYPYYLVSRVICGTIKGNFGLSHQVAVELGMTPASGTVPEESGPTVRR